MALLAAPAQQARGPRLALLPAPRVAQAVTAVLALPHAHPVLQAPPPQQGLACALPLRALPGSTFLALPAAPARQVRGPRLAQLPAPRVAQAPTAALALLFALIALLAPCLLWAAPVAPPARLQPAPAPSAQRRLAFGVLLQALAPCLQCRHAPTVSSPMLHPAARTPFLMATAWRAREGRVTTVPQTACATLMMAFQSAPLLSSLLPAAAVLLVSTPLPPRASNALLARTPHQVPPARPALLGHTAAQVLLFAPTAPQAQPPLQQPLSVSPVLLASTSATLRAKRVAQQSTLPAGQLFAAQLAFWALVLPAGPAPAGTTSPMTLLIQALGTACRVVQGRMP